MYLEQDNCCINKVSFCHISHQLPHEGHTYKAKISNDVEFCWFSNRYITTRMFILYIPSHAMYSVHTWGYT